MSALPKAESLDDVLETAAAEPEEDTLARARPPESATTHVAVRPLISRYFFGSAAMLAGLAAFITAAMPTTLLADQRIWLLSGFALVSVFSMLATRASGRWVEPAMATVMLLGITLIAVAAVLIGWGLSAPGIGFFSLLVCIICAVANRPVALAVSAAAAAALIGIDIAPSVLDLPAYPSYHTTNHELRLLVHLLTLAAAVAGGLMISSVVSRHVRSAEDREQRFRGLLGIAADAYWEIDQHYRLVAGSSQRHPQLTLTAAIGLGQVPWELAQFGCEDETLDMLQADLQTRVPFRDLPVHWRRGNGKVRHFVVSGEPRFNDRGMFSGYWGVARDVTADVQARHALAATETRYQELFSRIPTPLVLHRNGRVIDANAAGVALFGYDTLGAMLGRDLLTSYESGDSRERERRRIEELDRRPPGEGLPVTDFRLTGRAGRRVSVRATGVRVDAEGGTAMLSIYVDDTERRATEEAVRRSEAMLSHLVATSPDVITLTDLATGRYAMVNQTFERLTGYSAAEVVGRTAMELGIWQDVDDRSGFVARLREQGTVQDAPTVFITKRGQPISMRVSGARFAMDRREYLVINARDVTASERARLEREAILETASIGIAVTRDQHFVLVNPCFEQMFGWQPGSLHGESGRVVWASDEDYAEVGASIGPALARGEQVEVERISRRRDGSTFLCRVVGKAIDPSHPAKGGTIWIVEDVTERRGAERALSAARDQAEAANRAKSAFLANTSHELRTPLHGMLGLTDMARAPDIDDALRRLYLDQISESAQTLTGIISDILDLSKIEAGKLQIEAMPFELSELLRSVHRAYVTMAAARDLPLHLDIDVSALGQVLGDPLRVRQIVSNYLSNAVKFTPRGNVRLSARRLPSGPVRIEVHDSGAGIDAETQARLFKPFTQADESTTRRFGGTGLGLSICRELALLMGGNVGVDSKPGSGSCFWAELPLPRPAAVEATEAATKPPAFDPVERLKGARVLMVEDNAVNMLIAVAMLDRWKVQVEQASDGRQAVEAVERAAARNEPFDAVLMDLQMPVMSGYEATRQLRKMGCGRHLPVIALTAAALVSEREQAMDAGMDDFLTKPIDADKLCTTLARWVEGRRRM